MITVFSIPKAPIAHIGIIQANAIRSWTKLTGCEVILFGEEVGLAEFASALGVRHVPQIGRNEQGTPLVSEAFEQALCLSTRPIIAYVNADIILMSEFVQSAETVAASGFRDFLVVGQRHDIDIKESLDFIEGWDSRLKTDVAQRATLHGKAGIDYFIFPRGFPVKLPPFAVGRPGWDSWLIYQVRSLGIPLIDASDVIMAVHQNHPSVYKDYGDEARGNTRLAGGFSHMGTIRDATWRLTHRGLRRFPILRRITGAFLFSFWGRMALAAKRSAQSLIARRRTRI